MEIEVNDKIEISALSESNPEFYKKVATVVDIKESMFGRGLRLQTDDGLDFLVDDERVKLAFEGFEIGATVVVSLNPCR